MLKKDPEIGSRKCFGGGGEVKDKDEIKKVLYPAGWKSNF